MSAPAYTLYCSPGAASLVVHQFLIEARLPHRLEKLDLQAQQHKQPEYLKLNPNGVVPTLVVDGEPMIEAAAMLLYLADRHSEAGFAPSLLAPERKPYLQWIFTGANTLQPAFRTWFYAHEAAGAEHADAAKDRARQRIEAVWGQLDTHLLQHGPFVAGTHYSAADMYLTMLMRWSRNMPRPATDWPRLKALADRVRARPAWSELYKREGLTEWALA